MGLPDGGGMVALRLPDGFFDFPEDVDPFEAGFFDGFEDEVEFGITDVRGDAKDDVSIDGDFAGFFGIPRQEAGGGLDGLDFVVP